MNQSYRRFLHALLIVATVIVVTGCGDDSTTAPPTNTGLEAKFGSIQTNILTPTCAVSGCHAGANPQMGLNLTAGAAYASLVGVASTEVPSLKRVEAGSIANSYLVDKIEGSARMAAGTSRMPVGGTLSAVQIQAIKSWIAAGAKND